MNLEMIKAELENVIEAQNVNMAISARENPERPPSNCIDLRTRVVALSSLAQIAVIAKAEAAAERRFKGLMKEVEKE